LLSKKSKEKKMKTTSLALAIVLTSGLVGCGNPFLYKPKLAADPPPSTLSLLSVKGEFTGEAHTQDDIGGMSVIFLKLRNDTDTARSIYSSRIVGVTSDNRKFSLISPGEAAYQTDAADNPTRWKGAATGLAAGALGGAAIGGLAGAMGGAVLGPPGMAAGAALGAAVGGGTGAIVGAISGAVKPARWDSSATAAQTRTMNRRLGDQVIGRASQVDGYVFLPKDNYTRMSLIVSSETQTEQELSIPIASAK
jgi:hypothetical protein